MKLQPACTSLQNHPLLPPHLNTVKNHAKNRLIITPRSKIELSCNVKSANKLKFRVYAEKGSEPFRGKSGSISFVGLTHQSVEEGKLESAPFTERNASVVWVLAPVALISSLVVPQFFIVSAIEDVFKNALFAEILSSVSTEVIFYVGLATFLLVTGHVQKPYLEFSPKSWSLITGLKGYLSSSFVTMGFKVFAPVLAVYVTWPVLGLPSIVSVAPLLLGCFAQFLFERRLESSGSSCWPVVPIIFEVYRIYQLTRATAFVEKLMFAMRDAPMSDAVSNRFGAFVSMVITFRVLAIICLWSLLTFLMRLFPSRPVAENY